MIWLGLRLLGLKKFIKENWKWLLPVLALVASFFIVSHIYYDKGVAAERHAWEERVKAESAKNIKKTENINAGVYQFGVKVEKEDKARVEKETVYKDKILTVIKNNPVYTDCKVEQDVIDSRNAIRAEGPRL